MERVYVKEVRCLCVSAEKLPAGFPQITQAPSTKVVEIGHNAVLLCSAVGTPPPCISWVRDMLPVDPSKNSRYSILDTGTGMPGTLGGSS
jgi:netrin-G3 ligand